MAYLAVLTVTCDSCEVEIDVPLNWTPSGRYDVNSTLNTLVQDGWLVTAGGQWCDACRGEK